MGAVYSAPLFSGLAAAGFVTAFTVPAGFIYVIRDVTAWQEHVWGVPYSGGFVLDQHNGIVWAIGGQDAQGQVLYQWHGHQAFNAGDTCNIEMGETGWLIRISGYKLTA